MNAKLSQKQIGQRIADLRKVKGLSQEDLSKIVQISRPSLAQIELGNRSVDILELQKMSFVLGFSLVTLSNISVAISAEIASFNFSFTFSTICKSAFNWKFNS